MQEPRRWRSWGALWSLPTLAVVSFAVYLAWNFYWLGRGVLPPSLLRGVTGVPSPTTGMTRALRALAGGEVGLSCRWHPLALPLVGLYLASLGVVGWRLVGRRRAVLPGWMVWAWVALLVGGWAIKLASGPAWW